MPDVRNVVSLGQNGKGRLCNERILLQRLSEYLDLVYI